MDESVDEWGKGQGKFYINHYIMKYIVKTLIG